MIQSANSQPPQMQQNSWTGAPVSSRRVRYQVHPTLPDVLNSQGEDLPTLSSTLEPKTTQTRGLHMRLRAWRERLRVCPTLQVLPACPPRARLCSDTGWQTLDDTPVASISSVAATEGGWGAASVTSRAQCQCWLGLRPQARWMLGAPGQGAQPKRVTTGQAPKPHWGQSSAPLSFHTYSQVLGSTLQNFWWGFTRYYQGQALLQQAQEIRYICHHFS